MSEEEQHHKLKYGDIVYIEYSSKDHNRFILRANSFNISGKCYVELVQLNLNNDNISYKNFINNLFMIFPKMKDDFLKNQNIFKEKLGVVKTKIKNKFSFEDNSELKEDITKLINIFQETKQEIEKETFLKEIGQPLSFNKEFILIHFDSQNFVQKIDQEQSKIRNSQLVLTENYSDDCIFLFSSWNSLDNIANFVFSNQNLFLCKKEKNMSSTNQYLVATPYSYKSNDVVANTNANINSKINKKLNESYQEKQRKNIKLSIIQGRGFGEQSKLEINNINNINDFQEEKTEKKYILNFIENTSSGSPFKIKICSNYIDPSNGLLSFSTPVWLVCQNIDRHLTYTPNSQEDFLNLMKKRGNYDIDNTTKIDRYQSTPLKKYKAIKKVSMRNSEKTLKYKGKLKPNDYLISFDTIDKNDSLNNIYGLFYVEQCENISNIKNINDDYLKSKIQMKIELKMSPFVQYHKIIRLLHATTRKYLGFIENIKNNNTTTYNKIMNNSSFDINDKTTGKLILMDNPDENCNWMFMESYYILDTKTYLDSKSTGIDKEKKLDDKNTEEIGKKLKRKGNYKKEGDFEENINKIKNKEILRIFHVKSQKFLCFDEINNKLMENGPKHRNIRNDIYKGNTNNEVKSITIENLSLSKTPYDSDLVRLIPSNSDQSWEIKLVLYYSEILNVTIQSIVNTFTSNIAQAEKRLSMEYLNNNSIENNFSFINKSMQPGKELKIEEKLKFFREDLIILKKCFHNLTNYCLNNFSRKYDITMSPGKSIFYRQQFLCNQKFLDRIFIFLKYAKIIKEKIKMIKDTSHNLGLENEKNNKKSDKFSNPIQSIKTIKKISFSNTIINDIEDILKYLDESIKLSFEFISAMCKDHPENKNKVFINKDLFLDYLLDYDKASKCFLDIIKDNENFMNLLTKENNDYNIKYNKGNEEDDSNGNVIQKIINHLNKSDKYDLKNLSTLSKFLITRDIGITSNQQYIFKEIFINGKDHFLMKIKPLYDDIQLLVVYKNGDAYDKKTLIEFTNSQRPDIVQYLATQLNLYADLCYGRNYVCIDKIRELFPLDHLIYHISKTDLNQEILAGLINILNFVYIDIEPHSITIYPSLIKVINDDFKVERVNKGKVKSYIPLDKLNLILCLSLFILNNIKYGKILVNSANINMIFNIIKLRLYENVIYCPMNIDEVNNNNLNRKLHNLKDEVKKNVIHGEEILIEKSNYANKNIIEKEERIKEEEEIELEEEGDNELIDTTTITETKNEKNKAKKKLNINNSKNINTFYYKFGYKYIEFNFEEPTGEEYLLFVLDRINDFFLNSLIINNIDYNTENKNIISQNIKSLNNNDILTQFNINFLMKSLTELKAIFKKDKNAENKNYKPILKKIEKVINYILDIKKEDMSVYLLENLFNANKEIIEKYLFEYIQNYKLEIENIEKHKNREKKEKIKKYLKDNYFDLFDETKKIFFKSPNIKEILLDDEYYYYQLFNHINCSYNVPKLFNLLNNNEDNQNILLGEKNKEKVNQNLLENSLFSEDNNNEKIINVSQIDFFNDENNKSNSDLIEFKDDNYFYNQINMPNTQIYLENFYMNSVIFKNLQELIVRILEMNIDDKLTKILLRMFTRLMSQRKELFDSIKNVLLLYNKEDLDKYFQCNISILELGLLAEKTEKWMTVDRALDNIRAYHDLDKVNVNKIKNDQKDFFAVYLTLYKFIHMIIDKETGDYLSIKEVKLVQTIFHSFQIENILYSLLREITQEFPYDNKENFKKQENNNNKMNLTINNEVIKEEYIVKKKNEKDLREEGKKNNFKTALEKLIKEIFKLFEVLTHKSSPNQSIIEVVEFTENFPYFKDLGFNRLITELSYDEKFVKLKTSFLLDRLKEQLIFENFSQIKDKFFKFLDIYPHTELRDYKKLLKKTICTLKLMKNLINRITETKYLSILIAKFVEINEKFDIFKKDSVIEVTPIENFKDNNKNILYLYTIQFAYYFLSIAYGLAKKSQRLKEYIYSLLNFKNINKAIIEIPFPYDNKLLNELKEKKLEKATKLVPKLKFYYKLKRIGMEIFFYLNQHSIFQIAKINENINKFYIIIHGDLKFIGSLKLEKENPNNINVKTKYKRALSVLDEEEGKENILTNEEMTIKDGYELILASFRKTIYKYLFKGVFPIIYNLKNIFKNNKEYGDFHSFSFAIEENWVNFLDHYLLKEKDKHFFKKIRKLIKKNESKFKKFFNKIDYFEKERFINIETNLNKYKDIYLELKSKEIIDNYKENELLFQMIMAFTSDLIKDIENNEIVTETIKKESKILAKHLKSKINFHAILKRSAKENEINVEDLVENNQNQDRDIPLVNIFLKFIQENYPKKKYAEEINTLIDLMSNINDVMPEILSVDLRGIEYIFFYKDKISELKTNFTKHVQKFFLNNGSIEIFLKIACEGNKIISDNTFPIIIHFFNNVLEGGNADVQKKFIQLFQSFPNSDNFFYHISQFFNKDIFIFLKDSSKISEPKIDMENLNTIKDILRFLQLLSENHNNILQNFLREQTTNRLSYNFVNILVEYLSMLVGKLSNIYENQEFTEYFINLYYFRLLSILDTICEFLQGPCQKNQEYLINTKIIESFDKILGEIILSPSLYGNSSQNKTDLNFKKGNETSEATTVFGNDYYKTGILDTILVGESSKTYTLYKNKINPINNKLFSKLTPYQKSLLIFKISLVFLSIIEGRKTKDNVIQKILRDFDYKLIFQKCVDIYLELKKNLDFFLYIGDNIKDINENELKNKIVSEAGFNLYFLIQYLLSFENEDTEFKKYASTLFSQVKLSKEQIESYDHYNELKEAMNFYSNNSLNIEILKDNIVFKVYCPKLSFFNGFDDQIKSNFEENAKRTSDQTKLVSLMNEKDKIYMKIKQLYILEEFFKKSWIFNILFIYPAEVQTVGFYLIVLMNLLIFAGYSTEKDLDKENVIYHVEFPGITFENSKIILKILGIIITLFSLIKLFEFITREAILIFKTLYTNYLKESYESTIGGLNDLEIYRVDNFFNLYTYKKIGIYLLLILDIKVLYALAYMVFALLGIFIHNFFFAFHLIEFIISQPILQYVFRAIVDPIAQLAYTFIFFFILIYFYSLIIFYNFQEIMPDNSCDSPVICMAYIYSNTFTSGGNLGNFIDEKSENLEGDMVRYALDISYTIIMVWLVWQMVSGLIIDTFESLRKATEDIEDDMKKKCFICGLSKEELEKYYLGKEGFEKHLKDHSIINYFLYTFYLEDKDSSEYSGLESYIKNEIDKESISWFPSGRSLKIEEWKSRHKIAHDS